MTSRSLTFIQLSHCTMWPLYVSPFFSSTSCIGMTSLRNFALFVALPEYLNSQLHCRTYHSMLLCCPQKHQGQHEACKRVEGSNLRPFRNSTSVSTQV